MSTSAVTTGKQQKYLPLIAMMFVTSMTFIDMTIVSIAAPEIEKELHISDHSVQWIINGYLLSLAAFFALSGRIADVVGHKRMAMIGTVIFAVSSALCGFTPEGGFAAAWIIGFRILQGFGAALLFPAALAIVVAAFPLRERGRALAMFFAVTGAFTALGPIAGGYLVQWDWRSIFWVNIPVAIIALILTAICKTTLAPKKEPIDWRGGLLIVIGVGLSVLGLQQASTWGWLSVATIGCVIVGLIFIAIFVWAETKTEYPIINVRIFKSRAFVADNFVLFFAMMTFVAVFFFLNMYAAIVLDYNAQNAGMFVMWFFVGFVVASQIGGAMLDRMGSKIPMIIGCAVGALGFAVWGFQSTQMSASAITPWIVIAGAGIGFLLGPASTDAVNRAFNASYGEVTGITQTLRNYGSALGMAILGTVMINVSQSKFIQTLTGFGMSSEEASTAIQGISGSTSGGSSGASENIPAAIRDKVYSAIQLDFAQSIKVVLLVMAVMMVLALLVAFIHPGGKVQVEDGQVADDESDEPEASGSKALIRKIIIFAIIFAIIWAIFQFVL